MGASPQMPNVEPPRSEGLPVVRLAMILSSFSPVFLLWAIRGICSIPDRLLIPILVSLIVIPNTLLVWRLSRAKKSNDCRTILIGEASDPRDHLLVYLFAMLIPLYAANLGSTREATATCVAMVFVVFLFWHLNLHYMNVVFAILGYRVFTVHGAEGVQLAVLLSKRRALTAGKQILAYRLSNSVYIERQLDGTDSH
jgi:hypothetical protein